VSKKKKNERESKIIMTHKKAKSLSKTTSARVTAEKEHFAIS